MPDPKRKPGRKPVKLDSSPKERSDAPDFLNAPGSIDEWPDDNDCDPFSEDISQLNFISQLEDEP